MRENGRALKLAAGLVGLALSGLVSAAVVEYRTPNVIGGLGPTSVVVGDLKFTNFGLQGVGRVAASSLDALGETLGSVSSMNIANWQATSTGYAGTLYTLPDRGYNAPPTVFSNYQSRIQEFSFTFTPFTGSGNAPGQNQIQMTYAGATRIQANGAPTTGLDPAPGLPGVGTLNGASVPFVASFGGSAVNRVSVDAEGLILKPNGTGYVSDEYGPNIYYFKPGTDGGGQAVKEIVAVLPLPAALQPRGGTGVAANQLSFNSAQDPATGRRSNQGMEGIGLTPDGKTLYGLMQSATIQDSTGNQQTRLNTRLLVYDVTTGANGDPVHTLKAEYVLQLPIFRREGDGGNPNRTAAQSEVIALGDGKLLVLSRDGNGLGTGAAFPAMFKSILLVDTKGATNVLGSDVDAPGGQVSPGGVLKPTITPLTWGEALNMLNREQLARFGINLDFANPDANTMSEKWEGLALVSALDPNRPFDYFLFVGNDNDFLTRSGKMTGADGTLFSYDAGLENDTWLLAYRVALEPVPEPGTYALLLVGLAALGFAARRGR